MKKQQWYVYADGLVNSVDHDNLHILLEQQQAKSQKSTLESFIWTSGMLDWEPLATLPFLNEMEGKNTPPVLPSLLEKGDPIVGIKQAINSIRHYPRNIKFWIRIGFLFTIQIVAVVLTPLISLIPFLGLIVGPLLIIGTLSINRGWRLTLMRLDKSQNLPPARNVFQYFRQGLLLSIVQIIYNIPEIILIFIAGRTWILEAANVISWLFQLITTGETTESLSGIIASGLVEFLLTSGFILFYPFLVWPFYRIAMMRYAKTGQWRVLFQLKQNKSLVFQNHAALMYVYFQEKLLWAISAITILLLSMVTFGVAAPFVAPVVEASRVYTTGKIYKAGMEIILQEEMQ